MTSRELEPETLEELAVAIQSEMVAWDLDSLQRAIKIGHWLNTAQRGVKAQGMNWIPWLAENTGLARNTASDWMRLAHNERRVVHCSGVGAALKELRAPTENDGRHSKAVLGGAVIDGATGEVDSADAGVEVEEQVVTTTTATQPPSAGT